MTTLSQNQNNYYLDWLFRIALIVCITLFIVTKCKSQTTIYGSICVNPPMKLIGVKTDILLNRINTAISYNIGNTPNYDNNILFQQYQLGIGWRANKNQTNENGLIITPFVSYNITDHKYYNTTFGLELLFEITRTVHAVISTDTELWTTVGFGIKLYQSKSLIKTKTLCLKQ